jgi:benzylsuccinate CoA-transferase BbsF subunit
VGSAQQDSSLLEGRGVWAGTKIVEFGSGAAGPIALRYFTDHGATVVRIESSTRPDFIRVYAMGPKNPHGLEGSPFFANINAGKLGVTLNMKDPRGVEIAKQLVGWADGVLENFAPKAMAGWGMTWDDLSAHHPELVMVSACLLGQTGPQKDYPGFGGQGAALSGYNYLTGWPDREPLGPNGTITDSLAPRFAAAGLAAGLLHKQRTGQGCYVDLSQVEVALWTLGPWLLDHGVNGHIGERSGNRTERAAPHGAFPCLDEGDVDDRWVSVAAWTDDDWARLADVIGVDDLSLAGLAARKEREDEVEKILGAWTSTRTRREAAETLQGAGVEAYEVLDWADVHDDPQLEQRRHFVTVEHPVLGEHLYEENGFRLSATPGGVSRPGPTLGQHNQHVLVDLLGLAPDEVTDLAEAGVLS